MDDSAAGLGLSNTKLCLAGEVGCFTAKMRGRGTSVADVLGLILIALTVSLSLRWP